MNRREQRIVSGVRNGKTFREIAQEVGIHHRTAQRVADKYGFVSARSRAVRDGATVPSDFTKQGWKIVKEVVLG